MKLTTITLLSLLFLPTAIAEEKPKEEKKPTIVIIADGFPTGNATPEGVACDLARAFIKTDAELFKNTCIAPFGGGESRKAYEKFLKNVSSSIETEAKKKNQSSGGPKSLVKVFAARHLSRNGPASTGYAIHGFHDVMFVDVAVNMVSGKKSQNRTLVIKKKDGKWYAHPAPHTANLLSIGLNNEKPSTIDFKQVYTIETKKANKSQ